MVENLQNTDKVDVERRVYRAVKLQAQLRCPLNVRNTQALGCYWLALKIQGNNTTPTNSDLLKAWQYFECNLQEACATACHIAGSEDKENVANMPSVCPICSENSTLPKVATAFNLLMKHIFCRGSVSKSVCGNPFPSFLNRMHQKIFCSTITLNYAK